MKKDKNLLAFIIAVVAILIIYITSIYSEHQNSSKSNGVVWNGKQTIAHNNDINYISIPGFSELHFSENNLSQKVNLFNPEENHCYMNMSLVLSDGTLLWNTDNIMPGYGIYDIQLSTPLDRGTYNANYSVRCFDTETNQELNGCNIAVVIHVK